tara:strand:- start:2 stop:535 length:534 start_codon:yes stop_codon:yes gene_type:complete
MAQIIPIVSDALQATIRRLLPSQSGFGEDLQAQNVIVPIIDLTPSAEGSSLPEYMQRAVSYANITYFDISNTTTTIVNTPGFWQIKLTASCGNAASVSETRATLDLTDGLTTQSFWGTEINNPSTNNTIISAELVVFLSAGISLTGKSGVVADLKGYAIPIADTNGNLIDPAGFTPQ